MALTIQEQELYDFAKASLPDWIPDPDEFLMGAAKMFGSVRAMVEYLFGQAKISTATGPTFDLSGNMLTPDWLNQHAADRGTRRQLDEDDISLRARLRTVPDSLTREALLAAINTILAAQGVSGTAAIVELPLHGAHGGAYVSDAGVGGLFEIGTVLNGMKFTPTAGWARPPYWAPTLVPGRSTQLLISGAANANNNGTHLITGLEFNAALYIDANGGTSADAGVSWAVLTRDVDGNVRDGFARAYSQRGYRSARITPLRIVIILPWGSTAATEASVREALRQKKAAGIAVTIERRLIAP